LPVIDVEVLSVQLSLIVSPHVKLKLAPWQSAFTKGKKIKNTIKIYNALFMPALKQNSYLNLS
jgi:hypothetical protein